MDCTYHVVWVILLQSLIKCVMPYYNMKKNLNKFKKKINIYINNHPEWGGTFQYTNLIINAIESKFDKSSINFYFANKSWSKEFSKKGNFINLNFFSLLLIHILIFVESKKLARFISKFFLT